jgi:predicted kinase
MSNFGVILSGVSGSGKSTAVDELSAVLPDAQVVSLDEVRADFVKEHNDAHPETPIDYQHTFPHDARENKHPDREQFNAICVERYNSQFENILSAGQTFIHDRTNLSAEARQPLIEQAQAADYALAGVAVQVPLEEIVRRQRQRDLELAGAGMPTKDIPDWIIEKQIAEFVLPEREEGFDTVHHIDGSVAREVFSESLRELARALKDQYLPEG